MSCSCGNQIPTGPAGPIGPQGPKGDTGTLPYLVYSALLTQSGTSAPTASVLQNTLGGTLVWTYNGVGDYLGNLTGAFPDADKVFMLIGPGTTSAKEFQVDYDSDNRIRVRSYDNANNPYNNKLTKTAFELRVYPLDIL